jgi:hypothetical protein
MVRLGQRGGRSFQFIAGVSARLAVADSRLPGLFKWQRRLGMRKRNSAFVRAGLWRGRNRIIRPDPGDAPAMARGSGRWQRVGTPAWRRLVTLTELVRPTRGVDLRFGFNEWFRAPDGSPCGQDWQTWSSSMFLYAAPCMDQESTPSFEQLRQHHET